MLCAPKEASLCCHFLLQNDSSLHAVLLLMEEAKSAESAQGARA